ncbi:MAG: 3'-5' exoribonuclease YhaM family protein [Planctomycetaceae bacterium]
MTRQFVNELTDAQPVDEIYLLSDKQLRANRNASLYLSVDLRDRTGLINARMWNVTEESVAHIHLGDLVRVRGKVQLFQGTLQLILNYINSIERDGYDLEEFLPQSSRNTDQQLQQLREILLSIDDVMLRTLMECFLADEQILHGLSQAPAGVKTHHAYHGGLLEHVVNILQASQRIADLYPQINHNVLLVGIFLHDIGKIRELDYTSGFVYTDAGQLLGHLILGIEMLNDKIAEVEKQLGTEFPTELALRLKHMILSHHGSYEFGSPKLPMTPEAIALHHLDNLDAKVHEFSQTITEDPNPQSHWTPFSNRLDRKLFKGSKNGA